MTTTTTWSVEVAGYNPRQFDELLDAMKCAKGFIEWRVSKWGESKKEAAERIEIKQVTVTSQTFSEMLGAEFFED